MSCPGRGPTDDIIINFSAWDGCCTPQRNAAQPRTQTQGSSQAKRTEPSAAIATQQQRAINQSSKQAATSRKPHDLLPHD